MISILDQQVRQIQYQERLAENLKWHRLGLANRKIKREKMPASNPQSSSIKPLFIQHLQRPFN